MRIQAILLAGDRGASRAVRGTSKAFVEVAGKPMVVHVLEALLHTPEVSEVFATGDTLKLEKAFAEHGCVALSAARGCALHLVPQASTLYENIWNSFLRSLPPGEPDPEHAVLVVPSDIPLVVPEEIREFLSKAAKLDADYVIGLTPEEALEPYRPRGGEPGIEMAYFNLREGRLRQNNLHCVRPLKMRNRHYVQDMYENRYQKEWGNMLRLAWRVLSRELRNLWVLGFYLVMHVAGVLQRRGYRRLSDRVRRMVALSTVERGMSDLLQTRVLCATTGLGGAALDIDNAEDLEVAQRMFARWKREQLERARGSRPGVDGARGSQKLSHMHELFRALFGGPAAWRDLPGRGLLRVTGGDRVRFLNGMLSADIAALREGAVASALQLDRKGHVQAEVEVVALPGEIWLDTSGAAVAELSAVLERHIIADDVKLEDLSVGRSQLSIEGPGALAAAAALGAPELTAGTARSAGDLLWLGGGALTPDGVRVLGPAASLAELRARTGLPEIGDEAAEILRIDAGRPLLGVDTGERSFPQEARLERRAVSFKKGCYIGQEIVARIQSRGGVNRLLVKLSADAEVARADEITAGGRSTGRVTSAALSPVSGPIALGYVRPDDAVPGTPLRIGSVAGVVLES